MDADVITLAGPFPPVGSLDSGSMGRLRFLAKAGAERYWLSMSLPLDELRRLVARMDPSQPLDADSDLYVPFDDATHARGECSCIDRLERTIQLSANPTCQLFTGFPGSGKTTELKRLAAGLEQDKRESTCVLLVDFEEYIDRHSLITIADVLRVLAYCLDREATVAEGKDPDKEHGYLDRFVDYLATTEVDLKKLGFERPDEGSLCGR